MKVLIILSLYKIPLLKLKEKIMNIPYSGIITEGIKEIYNWKKVCEGCKKEFDEDYPFDDCEICGSKIFKRRIKVNR